MWDKKVIVVALVFIICIGATLAISRGLEDSLHAQEESSYESICLSLVEGSEDFKKVSSLTKEGTIVFEETKGKGFVAIKKLDTVEGYIEIAVAINKEGLIMGVQIISQEYKMGKSGDIDNEEYLSSYIGKSTMSKNISKDSNVKPVPGAVELSDAVYKGVKEAVKEIREYRNEEK